MFMEQAIAAARQAGKDIPVGAIIVRKNKIIAAASNRKEIDNDVTAHAEILALKAATQILNSRRLSDCELYVTLEPCPMCAWAILQAGIKSVYFGAYDSNYGALGSVIDLRKISNSKTKVYGGIMEQKCRNLLDEYFRYLRHKTKN